MDRLLKKMNLRDNLLNEIRGQLLPILLLAGALFLLWDQEVIQLVTGAPSSFIVTVLILTLFSLSEAY